MPRTFHFKDYVASTERFFFTRKRLSPKAPRITHNHDHHEIFWIKAGIGTHLINQHRIGLKPGSLVFIRPQDEHALISSRDAPLELVNVSISNQSVFHLGERYAEDLTNRFFWTDAQLPTHLNLDEEQQRTLTQMEHLLENGTRSLARIEGFILEIASWLGDEDERYRHLPSWLKIGCEKALKPEVFRQGPKGFVHACGRGHEHVCRAMRQHLGVSPAQHINQIRMAYAARQLANTDTRVEDIAQHCGLDNLSHFYREFKRHTGMTPAKYRREYHRDPVQPAD